MSADGIQRPGIAATIEVFSKYYINCIRTESLYTVSVVR